MQPLLSIIIPIYNAEKTISRLLNSIYELALNEQEFEVIAVDDCSCDQSVYLLYEYAHEHPNLIIHQHSRNEGTPSVGRNEGIKMSTGRYVWFVDSDDKIIADHALPLLNYLRENDLDFIFFNNIVFDAFGTYRSGVYDVKDTHVLAGTAAYVQQRMFPVPWNKILKRSFLLQHELFFPTDLFPEDHAWVNMCFLHARKVRGFATDVYMWHRTPNSLSSGKDNVSRYLKGFPKIIASYMVLVQEYRFPKFWVHALSYLFRMWTFFTLKGVTEGTVAKDQHQNILKSQKQLARLFCKSLPLIKDKLYVHLLVTAVSPQMAILTIGTLGKIRRLFSVNRKH